MRNVLALIAVLCIVRVSPCQNLQNQFGSSEIILEIQKEINQINSIENGRKTKRFKNYRSKIIYELKNLINNNSYQYLKISETDTVFRHSLTLNYIVLKEWNGDEQVLEDLFDDFYAKASSHQLGLNAPSNFEIPVTVTTYDSLLNEISGYYVYWNFWFDKDNNKSYSNFNNFTSPSSSSYLVPALYDIWVQKIGETKRFPPLEGRIKQQIFLNGSEKVKELKIAVYEDK